MLCEVQLPDANVFHEYRAEFQITSEISADFGVTMTRIKLGVVGLGGWGYNVARCLYELPECELVACSDLSPERRSMAERNWNARTV